MWTDVDWNCLGDDLPTPPHPATRMQPWTAWQQPQRQIPLLLWGKTCQVHEVLFAFFSFTPTSQPHDAVNVLGPTAATHVDLPSDLDCTPHPCHCPPHQPLPCFRSPAMQTQPPDWNSAPMSYGSKRVEPTMPCTKCINTFMFIPTFTNRKTNIHVASSTSLAWTLLSCQITNSTINVKLWIGYSPGFHWPCPK